MDPVAGTPEVRPCECPTLAPAGVTKPPLPPDEKVPAGIDADVDGASDVPFANPEVEPTGVATEIYEMVNAKPAKVQVGLGALDGTTGVTVHAGSQLIG